MTDSQFEPLDDDASPTSEEDAVPNEDAVPDEISPEDQDVSLEAAEPAEPVFEEAPVEPILNADPVERETEDEAEAAAPAAAALPHVPGPESVDEPVEVEPELAAAVEEALEGAGDGEDEEAADEWVPGDWFVVHTYAGYENKVKVDLETRVASMNMEDSIYEVVIPMEEVTEVKGGKKQLVQRKVFPGYLLVRMELNDDSWYVVRNTPGVTGFVGSANKPIPLSDREVDKILQRGKPGEEAAAAAARPRAEWQAGDSVRVTQGPFANFQGSVSEVDEERAKVKVLVNIFGRETPVELAFDQIAKV